MVDVVFDWTYEISKNQRSVYDIHWNSGETTPILDLLRNTKIPINSNQKRNIHKYTDQCSNFGFFLCRLSKAIYRINRFLSMVFFLLRLFIKINVSIELVHDYLHWYIGNYRPNTISSFFPSHSFLSNDILLFAWKILISCDNSKWIENESIDR